MKKLLAAALQENKLTVTENAQQTLLAYLELITTWNRVFNLTAILEPREMIYLHLIDSLIVARYLQGQHFLDVGSGAGLPGIPLAILNPEQQWTLLDKNSKKTRFLTQVIAELGLPNVKVFHDRAEDFAPSHGFDSILSRAFGSLSNFTETTEHLLNAKGQWIALKGNIPHDEIAALPKNIAASVIRLDIKGIEVTRHLVVLKRVAQ